MSERPDLQKSTATATTGATAEGSTSHEDAKTVRDVTRKGGNRSGGPWGNAMPTEKSLNFGPSAKRLVGHLAPQRLRLIAILAATVISVVLSVIGPKILGHATDLIFDGFTGRTIGAGVPAGTSLQQVVDALRASGDDQRADMLASMNVIPGVGIDFPALGHILLIVLALYIGASVVMYAQGFMVATAVNRAMRDLRAEAEAKLGKLPLAYFDRQPRGEVLSRVTNDVDNIS